MFLRKSKIPRKSPEKWTFLSLAFYIMHLVCTLLKQVSKSPHRYLFCLFLVFFTRNVVGGPFWVICSNFRGISGLGFGSLSGALNLKGRGRQRGLQLLVCVCVCICVSFVLTQLIADPGVPPPFPWCSVAGAVMAFRRVAADAFECWIVCSSS